LIAPIINAHPSGTEIDAEIVSLYQRPSLRMDADVKTRFSSRLTRQQAV